MANIGVAINAYEGSGSLVSLNIGFGYNRLADFNYDYSFQRGGQAQGRCGGGYGENRRGQASRRVQPLPHPGPKPRQKHDAPRQGPGAGGFSAGGLLYSDGG